MMNRYEQIMINYKTCFLTRSQQGTHMSRIRSTRGSETNLGHRTWIPKMATPMRYHSWGSHGPWILGDMDRPMDRPKDLTHVFCKEHRKLHIKIRDIRGVGEALRIEDLVKQGQATLRTCLYSSLV